MYWFSPHLTTPCYLQSHYGTAKRESLEEKAERVVEEELGRLGWAEAALRERRKGDNGKVAIARRLRRETTMTYGWIAKRLYMGSWGYVFNLLKPAKNQKV